MRSIERAATPPLSPPRATALLHGRAPCAVSRTPAITARSRCTPFSRVIAAVPPPPRHQGKGLVDDLQTRCPAIRTNPGAGDALSARRHGLGRADPVRPCAGPHLVTTSA